MFNILNSLKFNTNKGKFGRIKNKNVTWSYHYVECYSCLDSCRRIAMDLGKAERRLTLSFDEMLGGKLER